MSKSNGIENSLLRVSSVVFKTSIFVAGMSGAAGAENPQRRRGSVSDPSVSWMLQVYPIPALRSYKTPLTGGDGAGT